jgi:hypothetical protein
MVVVKYSMRRIVEATVVHPFLCGAVLRSQGMVDRGADPPRSLRDAGL